MSHKPAAVNQADLAPIVRAATAAYLRGHALDMSTLATALGVGRATLYRRIGNHEELMGRVLADQTEATYRSVDRGGALAGMDAVQAIVAEVAHRVVSAAPLRILVARDPVAFMRIALGPGRVETRAIALVADLVTRGAAGERATLLLPAEVLAQAVVRVLDSFMYVHLLHETEPQLDAGLAAVQLLLRAAISLGRVGRGRAPAQGSPRRPGRSRGG